MLQEEEHQTRDEDQSSLPHEHKSILPTLQSNPKKDFFPLCIVWTPLPVLTWLLPFIGHMGIATSEGMIHDFVGPYYIHKNKTRLGFGPVTKYYQIHLNEIQALGGLAQVESWDAAVEESSERYSHLVHNLFCNNCHNHVAMALNKLEFRGFKHWNTLSLMCFMSLYSSFASFSRFLRIYLPFGILLGLALVLYFFVLKKS
eukprot:TRINITY_DN703_c0_g1_i1.p1 TRINITY_DN703_c0_g1~~TRINITY_DN703_c0_g1_i1.p1  ORF type:complete len:201 (-),score=33.54 TRINITY_DN703_c0_g1_i1:210-812(-)